MQITFVSNYINHHQIPLSEELYRLTGGNYTFIQTEPMEEERVKMGWASENLNKPYLKLYYKEREACDLLIKESDCVLFGGTDKEEIIAARLKANKLVIRISERLYREGRWKFVSPRGLVRKYKDHVRYNKNDVYLLCAGAYVKGDFDLVHAYPGKKLKYGYFTELIEYDDLHKNRRNNEKTEILWAARFIELKHPEMLVKLAGILAKKQINAHITMIGDGPEFQKTKDSAEGFSNYITFVGSKKPKEVREYMEKSDIFISSSDRLEGWGAVVNEAMNSGCVTIAAKDIGAAPYLIKDGENGFMYKACDMKKLSDIVCSLCGDKVSMQKIGDKAYELIKEQWNPIVAAKRLYDFISDPEHDCDRYKEGPLSRA